MEGNEFLPAVELLVRELRVHILAQQPLDQQSRELFLAHVGEKLPLVISPQTVSVPFWISMT